MYAVPPGLRGILDSIPSTDVLGSIIPPLPGLVGFSQITLNNSPSPGLIADLS